MSDPAEMREVPRPLIKQDLLYSIDSLKQHLDRMYSPGSDESLSPEAEKFFVKAREDLENCERMVKSTRMVKKVYIYQKLLEIRREMLEYSSPAELKRRFLQLKISNSKYVAELDECHQKAMENLHKYFCDASFDGSATPAPSHIISDLKFFVGAEHNKKVLTIWRSEALKATSTRLGLLLVFALIPLVLGYVGLIYIANNGSENSIEGEALRLLVAFFAGMVGGGLSAIATTRGDSEEHGASQLPIIDIDWMRPVLGGVAGLVFVLIASTDAADVNEPFLVLGAIAFGFSERLLYSLLKKRSNELEKALGGQVAQRVASQRKEDG